MVDAPALWLWCDCETTGLLDLRPAVLEVAWMVTDSELNQLTPLRQRLTALPRPWTWWQCLFVPRPVRQVQEWPRMLMPEAVQRMHEESGLAEDWRVGEKIRDVRILDDLLTADLADATLALNSAEKVETHLAGAGVAQFEAALLPAVGSGILDWCHYRCADVSVARMVAGLPKTVTAWSEKDGLQLDPQPGVDELRAFGIEHRAAADVQAAYASARDLRARVQSPEVAVTYQWDADS